MYVCRVCVYLTSGGIDAVSASQPLLQEVVRLVSLQLLLEELLHGSDDVFRGQDVGRNAAGTRSGHELQPFLLLRIVFVDDGGGGGGGGFTFLLLCRVDAIVVSAAFGRHGGYYAVELMHIQYIHTYIHCIRGKTFF